MLIDAQATMGGQPASVEDSVTMSDTQGNTTQLRCMLMWLCEQATTRYLTMEARKRLMMVPIFDMSELRYRNA
jgi:hypothetical protein